MLEILNLTAQEEEALREISKELPEAIWKQDVTFILESCKSGFVLERNGNIGKLYYSDRRSFLRAIATIAEMREKTEYVVRESPNYEILGAMPDASRNAVPTVDDGCRSPQAARNRSSAMR